MATAQIIIKNGFFANAVGRNIDEVTPTYALLNGWKCFVNEDGSIECWSVREYSDGKHSMRYFINPLGFAKLTLKKPWEPIKTLKKGYVIRRGQKLSDGILGLAGDHIDYRYAYFRDSSFQDFLDEYGITAVKHEDPNRLYRILTYAYGEESSLVTDGTKEGVWTEFDGMWYQVTGATWVLYQIKKVSGKYSCILYTLVGDVTKIRFPGIK